MHKVKTAFHHWWPQRLSEEWFDENGVVHQKLYDREVVNQTNTKKFGGIKNNHTVRMSDEPTNWDFTYENSFSRADGNISKLVELLLSLETSNVNSDKNYEDRFFIQDLGAEKEALLFECCISLLVRSPQFNNRVYLNISSLRREIGGDLGDADENLVKHNIAGTFENIRDNLSGGGKYVVIFSDSREFIFGDGFYNNLRCSNLIPHDLEFLVPILPCVAVAYCNPLSYPACPKLVTIKFDPAEVDLVNHSIMGYSKKTIFYRSEEPKIIPEFEAGEHFNYDQSSKLWIRRFIDTFSQFHSY